LGRSASRSAYVPVGPLRTGKWHQYRSPRAPIGFHVQLMHVCGCHGERVDPAEVAGAVSRALEHYGFYPQEMVEAARAGTSRSPA
jgi:hypothetical protein